jgi:hypothetical protein
MDRPLSGAIHESLRLYVLCKGMRWTHLPVGGGLYDQHPKFLDDLHVIMSAQNTAEKIKHERSRPKNKQPKTTGRGGSRMRRR